MIFYLLFRQDLCLLICREATEHTAQVQRKTGFSLPKFKSSAKAACVGETSARRKKGPTALCLVTQAQDCIEYFWGNCDP